MTAIVRPKSDAHWYLADGTPFHEVPNKSKPGEMRPTTIVDAKKAGALPSVTSILQMIAKPMVTAYQVEQALRASLRIERAQDESDDDYLKRVLSSSEAHRDSSVAWGLAIDEACKLRALDRGAKIEPALEPYVSVFIEWLTSWGPKLIAVDERIVEPVAGYAGTADGLIFTDDSSRFVVYDIKTQDVKNDKPGFYPEYPEQLAAYGFGYDYPNLEAAYSVVIDRMLIDGKSRIYIKEYSRAELYSAYECFQAAAAIWRIRKNYDPRKL